MKSDQKFTINWESLKIHSFLDYYIYENRHYQVQFVGIRDSKIYIQGISDQSFKQSVDLQHNLKIKPFRTLTKPSENLRFFHRRYCYWGDGFYWSLQQLKKLNELSDLTGGNNAWDIIQFLKGINFYMIHSFLDKRRITQNNFQLNFQYIKEFLKFFQAYLKNVNIAQIDFKRMYESPKFALIHSYPQLFINLNQLLIEPAIIFNNSFNKSQDQQTIASKAKMAQISLYCKKWLVNTFIPQFIGNQQILKNLNEDAVQRLLKTLLKFRQKRQQTANSQPALNYSCFSSIIVPLANHLGSLYCSNPMRKVNENVMLQAIKQFIQLSDKTNRQQFLSIIRCKLRLVILLMKRPKEDVQSLLVNDKLRFFTNHIQFVLSCSDYQELRELVIQFLVGTIGNQGIQHYIKNNMHNSTEISKMYRMVPNQLTNIFIRLHKLDSLKNNIKYWDYQHLTNILNLWKVQGQRLQQIKDKDKQRQKIRQRDQFLMSYFVSKFIQPIFHNLQQIFKGQKIIYQKNQQQCQKLLNIEHIHKLEQRGLFLKVHSQFQEKLIKLAERVYDGQKTSSIQYIDNAICKKMIKNNPQLIINYISKKQFTTFSEKFFLESFFKQYKLSRPDITGKNIFSMCFSKLCESMIQMKTKELLQLRRQTLITMLRRLSVNLPEQLISHLCLYLVSVSKVQSLEFKSKTYQFLQGLLTHHNFQSQQQKLLQYKQCLDSMTVQTQVQYRTFIWLFKQINQSLLSSPLIKFIKNEQMVFVPAIIFGRPYGLKKIYDILDRQMQRGLVKKCNSFFYRLHKKVVDEQLRDQLVNEICHKIMNYLENNWRYCCIGYGNLERKRNKIQQENFNDFIALIQDYTVRYSSEKEIFKYYTNLNISYLKLLRQEQAKTITTQRQKVKIIVNLPSNFNIDYSGMEINDEGFEDVLEIENREEENMTEQNGKKSKNLQFLMDDYADNIIAKIKQKAADHFQISPICSSMYLTDILEAGNGKTNININKKVSFNDEVNSIQGILLNYRMEICSKNDQNNISSLEQANNLCQADESQNNQINTIVFTLKPFEKGNFVQQTLRDKLQILFIWLPNTKLIWDYLSITSYDWQINSKLANLKNFLISYPNLSEQFQPQKPEIFKALLNAVMGQPIRKKIFLQAVLETTNHENKAISWLYAAFGEICNAVDVQNNQLVLQILIKTERNQQTNQDLAELKEFECFQLLMHRAIAQDSTIKDFEDSYYLFIQKLFQYVKNRYRNNLFDYLKLMKSTFYVNLQTSSKFFKLFIEALTQSFIHNLVSSSKFLNSIQLMLNYCSYPLKIVSQYLLKNPSLIPYHPCCNQWLKSNLLMIENPQFRNQYKKNPLPCRIILNFITALTKRGYWSNFKNISRIIMEETFSKLGKEIVMIMTAICSKPQEQESITEQGRGREQTNSKFIKRSQLAKNFIEFFMRQTDIPDWLKSSSIKFTRNYNVNDMVYVGLKNPHSICYVNTFLQQLYHIQEFREQLYRTNWKKNDVIEQDLIYQLKKIFVNLNFRQCESYINHGFFEAFKNIQGEPTSLEVQMDVDEFRSILLDRLENLIIKPENQSLNFIQKLFSVKQVTIIKSTQCQHSSSKDQNQYSLCLQVKGFKKLSESLENYFKPEVLKGDNSYLCEDCNRKVTAEKTFIIKQYPKYLTFVLKRFEYVNYFKKKINQRLQFPINQMNIQGNEYFLKGVIVHQGISQAGHYISLIKINGKWFQFNDNLVSQINEQIVKMLSYGENGSRINRNAYLLIYQKDTMPEEIKMEEQSSVQLPYKLKFQEQINSIRKFNALSWKTEVFFSEEFEIFIETIVKNRIEGSINLLYKYITTIKGKCSRFNLKSIQNLFNLLENYSTSSLLSCQQHVFYATHFYRKNHLNSSIIVQFTSILIKRYQKFDAHMQYFLIQCLYMINQEIQTSHIYQLFLAFCKKDKKILKYLIDARIIGRIYKACWPSILLTADIQQLAKSTQINFPTGNELTQGKKKFQQSYLRYHKWQLIRYIIQSGYPLHKTEQSFVSNWAYRKAQLIFEQATTKSTINEISKFFCFLSVKNKYFGDCYLKEICQQITKDKPENLLRYLKSALDLVRINDSHKLIRMREIFASFKETFKNLQRNKMPLIFDIKFQWFLKICSCPEFRPILQQNFEQLKFMANHHQMQLLIFSRNQQSSNNDLKIKNRFYGLKFAIYQQPGYSSQIFQQKVQKARRLLLGQAAQPSRDSEQMQNDENLNDQMIDESWLQKDLLDYPEAELKQGTKILRFSEKTMVFEQVEITGVIGDLIQIGDEQTYDRGDERLTLPFEYQKTKREDDLKKQFGIQSQQ